MAVDNIRNVVQILGKVRNEGVTVRTFVIVQNHDSNTKKRTDSDNLQFGHVRGFGHSSVRTDGHNFVRLPPPLIIRTCPNEKIG